MKNNTEIKENINTDDNVKSEIVQGYFEGERPLFKSKGLKIKDTVFGEGESPLKESEDIELTDSNFQWKYPLWYCKNVQVDRCTWMEMARAGVWYTDNIDIANSLIEAPKNFRRCNNISLQDVYLTNASETLWNCNEVKIQRVNAKGDYFAMNCKNIKIDKLNLVGNYSFDGVENAVVYNSRLLSKDAFWNSTNVTVYDSYICGEYLGWNAKNLTLINCTIESLQGMCYIENLVMKNCKLINTTLAFEYSTVNAEIKGRVDSIINPKGGSISADAIGTLIMDKDKINPEDTVIICDNIDEKKEF